MKRKRGDGESGGVRKVGEWAGMGREKQGGAARPAISAKEKGGWGEGKGEEERKEAEGNGMAEGAGARRKGGSKAAVGSRGKQWRKGGPRVSE